jgi:hypothetical protein
LRRNLLAACACALLVAAVAPAARAALPADSAGIYSEELEPANSADPVATGRAERAAGVGIVRQPFSWARVETSPGVLDYAVYDAVMRNAALAGLAVLPVLMDPPAWRSTAPASGRLPGMYPPQDPDAMAVFAGALVRRYGPDGSFWAAHPELTPDPIHSWQVWNEPNYDKYWQSGPDPAAYVRLLRPVAAAIRAADPSAEVVSAGLPSSAAAIGLTTFIAGMYAAGARGTFDTLGVHPYARDAPGALAVLRSARDELDRLGDRDRPIWATEFGWASGGPSSLVTTDEATQAQRLHDAIGLMQRARTALHLRGFIAFRWTDVPLNAGQRDSWPLHTGLRRNDGTAKPALQAFSSAVALWRASATAAGANGPAATGTGGGKGAPSTAARTLRIRRLVLHGRLVVHVDVPVGRGGRRVRISYEALRGRHVAVRRARWAGTRERIARVTFALAHAARAADVLRVRATQGALHATRSLRLRRARRG